MQKDFAYRVIKTMLKKIKNYKDIATFSGLKSTIILFNLIEESIDGKRRKKYFQG